MVPAVPASTESQGRRRSRRAHEAILRAAAELMREHGYGQLTIEAIAARAGVGKQTIYRWWPSKGAVALEAFLAEVETDIVWADTGDLAADLADQLRRVAGVLNDPAFGPHIAALVGEAQHDTALAEALHQRVVAPVRGRSRKRFARAQATGQVRDDLDVDLAIDLLFSPLWFRLLVRQSTLNELDTAALTDAVLRAIRP